MEVDYLVVGSGLTGAVIARVLKDAGKQVLVVDRRSHVGGNVHDHTHPSGIRIHTYGPHYFRTNSDAIWQFVNRFSSFDRYEASLKTLIDGELENWPIAASYIRRQVGTQWRPEFEGMPQNFEEASLAIMPRVIYEKFVKGYSEKQWGVPANQLSASLAKRFDVREDDEPRLMRHKHQGIPSGGYANLMASILADIPLVLQCDYLKHRHDFIARKHLVFTGPIDEYFGFDLGKLAYRGQQRVHTYFGDVDYLQPCGQVNTPDARDGAQIRRLEWKHMMPERFASRIRGTVVTEETPTSPQNPEDYEYPFPDEKNRQLYEAYRRRLATSAGVTVCGRLGEYRYYDMDQAIARSLQLADQILLNSTTGQRRAA